MTTTTTTNQATKLKSTRFIKASSLSNLKKRKKTVFTQKRRQKPTNIDTIPNPTTQQQTGNTGNITYEEIVRQEDNHDLFQGLVTERLVIAYFYRVVLDSPAKETWDGCDGTINLIRNTFKFKASKKRIFNDSKYKIEHL